MYIKTSITEQQQKQINNSIKYGKGLEYTFFQGRHKNGQWAHEKVLNILHYEGTVIKTTVKAIPLYTY